MSISKYLVTLSINLVHDSEHKLNCKSDESNLPAIVQVLTAEYGRYALDLRITDNSYSIYFEGCVKLKTM